MKEFNVYGWVTIIVSTVLQIGLFNLLFKGSEGMNNWTDLYSPFESWWLACLVLGYVLGEAVRRAVIRRCERRTGERARPN
jgi:hypothetical protein